MLTHVTSRTIFTCGLLISLLFLTGFHGIWIKQRSLQMEYPECLSLREATENGCYIPSHRKTYPLKISNIPLMADAINKLKGGFKALANVKNKAKHFYEIPQDWTDAQEMLWFIQKRMDLPDRGMENISRFTARTAGMESDFRHWAINPDSGAAGLYQFIESPTNNSVTTAINRTMANYGRNGKPYPKWLLELAQHKEVLKLTPQQQTVLFLGNIGEAKGSDALLRRVHKGQEGAEVDLYEQKHYRSTLADPMTPGTQERAERFYGVDDKERPYGRPR